MAMSTDANLLEYLPEILNYGIDEFTDYHSKARTDILRRLRKGWWVKSGWSNEMDDTLLDETQFTKCASYLVLSEYALPQLTKWNAEGTEDRFQVMMKHYSHKYEEEFNAILYDGVRYDADDDGTVTASEERPKHFSRLTR
jgi:hypothetical protein